MVDLKLRYYRSVLIQTKRGKSKGKDINAKPILILSFFDLIEKKEIVENKIQFKDSLKAYYNNLYSFYEPESAITPFHKPFYYLQSDGYWHLVWTEKTERKSPSAKYLRDNVKYGTLDNALWDLLQDAQARTILRETVINHFLKTENKK